MAGSLIGKGGHNIQNLRTSFNCNVRFLTLESYKSALWNVDGNSENILQRSCVRFETVPLEHLSENEEEAVVFLVLQS